MGIIRSDGLIPRADVLVSLLILLMPSWTEIFGFITGAACVWLLVKQSIWNWPVAIANYTFFIVLFLEAKLYGDMALQFFYLAIAIYGWWSWLHGGADHRSRLEVSRTSAKAWVVLTAASIVMTAVFTFALRRYTDSSVPFLDAVTTSLSITAQFMQTRKWLETWHVWILADIIYIGLYSMKHLYLTAGLYAIFIAMCAAGLVEWRRSLSAQKEIQVANA
jgi:nicotinamide mononucleotide transporter